MIEIDATDLLQKLRAASTLLKQATRAVSEDIGADVIKRVTRGLYYINRTGKMSASVQYTPSEMGGKVTASAKHAKFLDEGTKPHRILPRRAKMLRFVSRSGSIVFARGVNHPGTKAINFSGKESEFVSVAFEDRMDRAAEEVVRRAGLS